MKEIQLTDGPYGHTLNATQVFSPDGQWVVYDTRNEDTHISRTGSIEKVNTETHDVVALYETTNQTIYGPGVGAAAWNPVGSRIIFIHGLINCDANRPYGFTRRFGAIVDGDHPGGVMHAEARRIHDPLIAGALRGGTHAHTWSGDGQWISFTYNDDLMEALEKSIPPKGKDLRTIGVMAPSQHVIVPGEDAENFAGQYFAVVTATVIENPASGTDDIDRAFDETWIGSDGYIRKDGSRQQRAIAFQGNVRANDGSTVTEVFVADIPADISQSQADLPLEGTLTTRPNIPDGCVQRRLTFTTGFKYPGIQGPRVRLRTSPRGDIIYFLMKDNDGIVQLWSIPTIGGEMKQLTHLKFSVQAQYNVRPDGRVLSVIADNRIWLVDATDGHATAITERHVDREAPVAGALWNPTGTMLVYNRYAVAGTDYHLQIFRIDLSP